MAKTLTKRDLVNKISAETNFTQIEVFDIVQRAVDIISSTLAEGDRVVIRNFGTFQVKEVKPKVGRNPKNPDQDVPIPARSVVKFKVGKELNVINQKQVKVAIFLPESFGIFAFD